MQRGHKRDLLPGKYRERLVVEVEVQHVEILGTAAHLLHHKHVWRDHVAIAGSTQRARPRRVQTSRGDGVATGEQRHLRGTASCKGAICAMRIDVKNS